MPPPAAAELMPVFNLTGTDISGSLMRALCDAESVTHERVARIGGRGLV